MSIFDKIGDFLGGKNEGDTTESVQPVEPEAPIINPEPDAMPSAGEEKKDGDCGSCGSNPCSCS